MYRLNVSFGNDAAAKIIALCPKDAPEYGLPNWLSFESIRGQEDAHSPFGKALSRVLEEHHVRVRNAYAPKIHPLSARIVERELLRPIRLGNDGIVLYRNSDIPASGVSLASCGEAFVMSTTDCFIIIAAGGNGQKRRMIVSCAEFDSLVDCGLIQGKRTRRCQSVVDAVIKTFRKQGVPAEEISMRVALAPTETFTYHLDEKSGLALFGFIKTRCENGCARNGNIIIADPGNIAVAQARMLGVRDVEAIYPLNKHGALGGRCQTKIIIVKPRW
jgi:hypothetical protein